MDIQTFNGPCGTRIQVYQGGTIAGVLLVQTSLTDKANQFSPCIRSLTAKDLASAQRALKRWQKGKN